MIVDKPVVTIIMPAFNAEQYIVEAIQSVLNQSFTDWELIVINDGSTDSTASLISTFKDKRMKLIEQINQGVSSARNRGLTQAKGEYITFLDADDVLPPQGFEFRVNYLRSNTDVDVVDGNIKVMDENMEKTIRIYRPYYQGLLLPRLLKLDSRVFFNVCYMFKRKLLGNIKFNEKMTHVEDLLFYVELSNEQKTTYGFVNEVVYYYRSGHVSAMVNMDGLEKGYIILQRYLKHVSSISLFDKFLLRIKVVKIMFLSWLSKKMYIKAFKSVFKLLF